MFFPLATNTKGRFIVENQNAVEGSAGECPDFCPTTNCPLGKQVLLLMFQIVDTL